MDDREELAALARCLDDRVCLRCSANAARAPGIPRTRRSADATWRPTLRAGTRRARPIGSRQDGHPDASGVKSVLALDGMAKLPAFCALPAPSRRRRQPSSCGLAKHPPGACWIAAAADEGPHQPRVAAERPGRIFAESMAQLVCDVTPSDRRLRARVAELGGDAALVLAIK